MKLVCTYICATLFVREKVGIQRARPARQQWRRCESSMVVVVAVVVADMVLRFGESREVRAGGWRPGRDDHTSNKQTLTTTMLQPLGVGRAQQQLDNRAGHMISGRIALVHGSHEVGGRAVEAMLVPMPVRGALPRAAACEWPAPQCKHA